MDNQVNRSDWESLSAQVAEDRRREPRIHLSFAIEVSGQTSEGQPFKERTVTESISSSGCRFRLHVPVEPGARLGVRLLGRQPEKGPQDRPIQFRVAWARPDEEGCLTGVAKLESGSIWCVTFPPSRQKQST